MSTGYVVKPICGVERLHEERDFDTIGKAEQHVLNAISHLWSTGEDRPIAYGIYPQVALME